MKFNVRYIHKVSQTCTCGHTQYHHRRPRTPADGPAYLGDTKLDAPVWGQGTCMASGTCGCTEFVHESQVMDIDVTGDGPGNVAQMLRRLIAAKVVTGDTKLRELRLEDDGRLVVYPDKCIWHSIILTPIQETA